MTSIQEEAAERDGQGCAGPPPEVEQDRALTAPYIGGPSAKVDPFMCGVVSARIPPGVEHSNPSGVEPPSLPPGLSKILTKPAGRIPALANRLYDCNPGRYPTVQDAYEDARQVITEYDAEIGRAPGIIVPPDPATVAAARVDSIPASIEDAQVLAADDCYEAGLPVPAEVVHAIRHVRQHPGRYRLIGDARRELARRADTLAQVARRLIVPAVHARGSSRQHRAPSRRRTTRASRDDDSSGEDPPHPLAAPCTAARSSVRGRARAPADSSSRSLAVGRGGNQE